MSAPYEREWAVRSAARAKGGGAWKRGVCEACPARVGKDDGKAKFNFNTRTGGFSCRRCGFKGRLRPHELDSIGYVIEEIERAEPYTGPAIIAPPEGFTPLYEEPGWSASVFNAAHAYLARRGITPELMLEAGIGACASGKMNGRVVVPILAPQDPATWFGYSARATWPDAFVKYLYPPGMDREHIVYNHDALLAETDAPAIIVEGVFDALALWPDAVAVLGKVSEGQMEALLSARRPLAVAMDGDAWAEGWALAARLRFEGARAGFVKLPPALDPATVPAEELRAEACACIDAPL
jgi:hypothetical protein